MRMLITANNVDNRLVSIFKLPFFLKIKCKHLNERFRYCSRCGRRLKYRFRVDETDNWTPNPYIDENVQKIRKKWYQFWR